MVKVRIPVAPHVRVNERGRIEHVDAYVRTIDVPTVNLLPQARAGITKRALPITISPTLRKVMADLDAEDHRALIVGGAVRDALLGGNPKDVDVEVYGINYVDLSQVLGKYGKVDIVGEAFGVLKFTDADGNDYDFSLPRRDSRVGVGHTGFETEFDPDISFEEAASRRDFTMNALAYDPIAGELHDYFGGEADLRAGVIRHTSDAFAEDPLRVLRGMQFAARMNLVAHPETAELSRSIVDRYDELATERVTEEFMKLARAKHPSAGLRFLHETGWDVHTPALAALWGTEQDPEWHPEGDAAIHTMHAADAAAAIADREGLTGDDRAVLVFASMLHDVGKPVSSQVSEEGRITSHGHAQAGAPIAREFLTSVGIKQDIIDRVVPLVEAHMDHLNYGESANARTIRRLAKRLSPATVQELAWVTEADHSGRPPLPAGMPEGSQRMFDLASESDVVEGAPKNFLQGRDVMPYFDNVGGPHIGEVLRAAFEEQMEGRLNSREEALEWLERNQRPDLLPQSDVFTHTTREFQRMSKTEQVRHLEEDHGVEVPASVRGRVTSRTPSSQTPYQLHITAHEDQPNLAPSGQARWENDEPYAANFSGDPRKDRRNYVARITGGEFWNQRFEREFLDKAWEKQSEQTLTDPVIGKQRPIGAWSPILPALDGLYEVQTFNNDRDQFGQRKEKRIRTLFAVENGVAHIIEAGIEDPEDYAHLIDKPNLLPQLESIPTEPGTEPIPEGHVRLFHVTPMRNAEAIRAEGLDPAKSVNIEFPQQTVWAQAGRPIRDDAAMSDGEFAMVEFHVDPADLDIGEGRTPEELEQSASHVTINRHIDPSEFVAVHEPWHASYRYLSEFREQVLAGEYDNVLDIESYRKAIERIKAEDLTNPVPAATLERVVEAQRTESISRARYASVQAAEDDVRARFGFADFTGIAEEELPHLNAVLDQIDRLIAEYPQVAEDSKWRFGGIGTYGPANPATGAPARITALADDSWGAVTASGRPPIERTSTAFPLPSHPKVGESGAPGPYLWLNTDLPLGTGTGMKGMTGFTAVNGPAETAVHEFGHIVAKTSRRDERGLLRNFDLAKAEAYKGIRRPERQFMRDVDSVYAGGDTAEAFAELFFRFNYPQDEWWESRSKAARLRLERLRDTLNSYAGQKVM